MTDVPLLVVATARPELLERRPGWGGGKLNATTLALSPLSDEQTAELIARLLGRPVLAADSQSALLERAGGNPLYAEQFVELYVEQGSTDELPLPETLQGIIAARLDGLPESEKSLLQDAAVVGKVFWASSIGREPDAATASLHSLERKGFVRRQRRSSLEGESEFAFAHALVRDVSYGQIPRADRAERHRAVAEWIDGLGRPEDHAEMLAYHWSSALELVRAAGGDDDELVERTRLALRAAGDRAFGLNSYAAAASLYDDALALWPEDDPERPDLLFRRARSLHLAGDDRRQQALEEARDALLDVGASEPAAEAEAFLGHGAWYRGDRDDVGGALLARAGTCRRSRARSPSKARVLALSATISDARREDGAAHTDRERGARTSPTSSSSTSSAPMRSRRSDPRRAASRSARAGAELEEALEIGLAADSPVAATTLNNLAVLARLGGQLSPRLASSTPRRCGSPSASATGTGFASCVATGSSARMRSASWDEALEAAETHSSPSAPRSPHYAEGIVRDARGSIRLARGDLAGAKEDRPSCSTRRAGSRIRRRFLPTFAAAALTCSSCSETSMRRGRSSPRRSPSSARTSR